MEALENQELVKNSSGLLNVSSSPSSARKKSDHGFFSKLKSKFRWGSFKSLSDSVETSEPWQQQPSNSKAREDGVKKGGLQKRRSRERKDEAKGGGRDSCLSDTEADIYRRNTARHLRLETNAVSPKSRSVCGSSDSESSNDESSPRSFSKPRSQQAFEKLSVATPPPQKSTDVSSAEVSALRLPLRQGFDTYASGYSFSSCSSTPMEEVDDTSSQRKYSSSQFSPLDVGEVAASSDVEQAEETARTKSIQFAIPEEDAEHESSRHLQRLMSYDLTAEQEEMQTDHEEAPPSPGRDRHGTGWLEEDEISVDNIEMGNRIGVGAYGEVYSGRLYGADVAMKFLLQQDLDNVTDFRSELAILRRLKHPNVVQFLGACTQPPKLMICTEFLPRGSLFRVLHSSGPDKNPGAAPAHLPWKRRLKMAYDAACGMWYLHSQRIVHRDLKSGNLLVARDWTVKVCDFGVSRVKNRTVLTSKSTRGTPEWMAPEMLLGDDVNEKADVYSFAMVMFELAALKLPYQGMHPMRVVGYVAYERKRPQIPADVDGDFAQLMQECWHHEPNDRPQFQEIVARLKGILHGTVAAAAPNASPIPSALAPTPGPATNFNQPSTTTTPAAPSTTHPASIGAVAAASPVPRLNLTSSSHAVSASGSDYSSERTSGRERMPTPRSIPPSISPRSSAQPVADPPALLPANPAFPRLPSDSTSSPSAKASYAAPLPPPSLHVASTTFVSSSEASDAQLHRLPTVPCSTRVRATWPQESLAAVAGSNATLYSSACRTLNPFTSASFPPPDRHSDSGSPAVAPAPSHQHYATDAGPRSHPRSPRPLPTPPQHSSSLAAAPVPTIPYAESTLMADQQQAPRPRPPPSPSATLAVQPPTLTSAKSPAPKPARGGDLQHAASLPPPLMTSISGSGLPAAPAPRRAPSHPDLRDDTAAALENATGLLGPAAGPPPPLNLSDTPKDPADRFFWYGAPPKNGSYAPFIL